MRSQKAFLFPILFLGLAVLAFSNGLNLNGLGARAVSMGGAYTALANDFSAVYWNPAGLAGLGGKVFGFYGTDIIPSGTYKLTTSPSASPGGSLVLVDAKSVAKNYLAGMAAYIHPISSRLVAAFGVYTPSGLGAEWKSADMAAISGGSTDIEWMSKVGLITFAPSLAFQISDTLSVGASLNINYGTFDISMYAGSIPGVLDLGQYSETETGWGLGATFGILFKPSKIVSLGAVLRTSSTVKFSGEAEMGRLIFLGLSTTSEMERNVTWPMEIKGGIAVTPTDALTLSADVHYTRWSVIDSLTTDYKDTFWSLLMTSSGKNVMAMHWKDAVQICLGGEYRLSPALALRAGYYYDPAPAPDETMNILLPSYNFNALTLGAGYRMDGLMVDAGLEYLMGKERTIADTLPDATPGVYNMKILVPCVSIGYRF